MGAIKCPECTYSTDDQREMDQHSLMHLKVAAVGVAIPDDTPIRVCARCGYKTQVELFLDAHKMVHEARIVRFEKLKTHIASALADSRTQIDTDNWNKALDVVNEIINACPDCGELPCKCQGSNGSTT